MKVIDLLNKIANGEVVPEKIKFDYQEYEYNDLAKTYYCGMNTLLSNYKFVILNDEVEIIEETPIISKLYINNELQYNLEERKIPEKINKNYNIRILDLDKPHTIKDYDMEQLIEMVQDLYSKQSEILDYLKIKGDE